MITYKRRIWDFLFDFQLWQIRSPLSCNNVLYLFNYEVASQERSSTFKLSYPVSKSHFHTTYVVGVCIFLPLLHCMPWQFHRILRFLSQLTRWKKATLQFYFRRWWKMLNIPHLFVFFVMLSSFETTTCSKKTEKQGYTY